MPFVINEIGRRIAVDDKEAAKMIKQHGYTLWKPEGKKEEKVAPKRGK